METSERKISPYPNIPPVIETKDEEYLDSGVTSKLSIAGHPIHPVIVTMPIGLLISALISDVVYWGTTDVFWARASFWLIVGGIISGVAAGITGMFDFVKVKRVRDRSAGWIHMIGNIGVLLLSIINMWTRLGDPASPIVPWGLVLSLVIASLLGVTGWFGGELTFRHKVGVIGAGPDNVP
jgi:uncharacterized membrane protein